MTGIDSNLVDELRNVGYSKQLALEVLLEECNNTFVMLVRRGASWQCQGREEVNFQEVMGYGVTAFEAVARMVIAVQNSYKKV